MEFDFDQEFNLKIKVDRGMQSQLLSEFSKVNNKFEPMFNWFNDPNVPQNDKDNYSSYFTRALAEMSFLYQLLKKCGITDEEIKEWAKIPF